MNFRAFSAALLLPPCFATALSAQVGHSPQSSPYREVIYSTSLTPFASYLSGDGGTLQIGPHDGMMYGVRLDHRLSTIISLGLNFETGTLQRLIVDADDPVGARTKGPVDQSLTMVEAIIQWNITGRKTWHGLAPYFGGTIGVVWAGDTPADTSGFDFGTRVGLAPVFGVRIFPSQRVNFRVEIRQLFWQLKYPNSYFQEPADDPGTINDPHAVLAGRRAEEWTGGTELKFGIGISF
jgi:hypothetical protein